MNFLEVGIEKQTTPNLADGRLLSATEVFGGLESVIAGADMSLEHDAYDRAMQTVEALEAGVALDKAGLESGDVSPYAVQQSNAVLAAAVTLGLGAEEPEMAGMESIENDPVA